MSSFLLTDVRIFDGQNTIDSGSVLVEGGKITQAVDLKLHCDGEDFGVLDHVDS